MLMLVMVWERWTRCWAGEIYLLFDGEDFFRGRAIGDTMAMPLERKSEMKKQSKDNRFYYSHGRGLKISVVARGALQVRQRGLN